MRQTGENVSPASNERRNSYVMQHLTDALIRLMEKYPFQEISITQICQEAEVGRASFYRNYESKQDILTKHLSLLMKEWGKAFESHGDPSYFAESLLRHYDQYKQFYLLLYRHGMSNMIYETIRNACQLDMASQISNDMASHCLKECCLVGLTNGCIRGCPKHRMN